MSLRAKFITAIISSILFIAIINIIAFYVFYSTYLKLYLYDKIQVRENVTLEYINEVIKKQTIDDIDSIFSDTELEFFELLENNDGEIPLNQEENVDIVVNYLVKSGLAPKYIEEIIPSDNFQKILEAIKDPNSPESLFVKRILYSILLTNLVAIAFVIGLLLLFVRKTLSPVRKITKDIKELNQNLKNSNKSINYNLEYTNKNDEIGMLVQAINNLNKRLSVQSTIRTRLLADISHELKTPITSIQTYLEGISDGVIDLNPKNLDAISNEMKRLINLVNKIMDYEKFDRTSFELNKVKFDCVQVLKTLSETHKKTVAKNNQRIKVTGINELIIEADKELFMQFAHNIIGNFIKYAGNDTVLTINVTKKYIDFSDNGQGVKSSDIPFLTEKFYQGNSEKTGDIDKRGIGVGLSIVTKIMESHKWRFEIKTEKSKGFSFKVFI